MDEKYFMNAIIMKPFQRISLPDKQTQEENFREKYENIGIHFSINSRLEVFVYAIHTSY